MTSPERRANRTLRSPSTTFQPTRVGLSSLGSTCATFEIWTGASFSMMPPGSPGACRVCRFTMLTPCTRTRISLRSTRSTSPVLPRSLPVMTTTLSPFLILNFAMILASPPVRLEHFRRQRNDLHELLAAQLARHRPEDAGADRLALLVDQHRRVAVEADRAAVGAADLLGGAHDHRLVDVALLHPATRDRVLDRDDDDVADGRVLALRPAQHLDALHPAGAGIVGDFQVGLHLNHGTTSLAGRGRVDDGRALGGADDLPLLGLRDRPAFLDGHGIADLAAVVLVMRRVLLRAANELLVDRVHDAALDADDHRLVRLVADHDPVEDAPGHCRKSPTTPNASSD